MLAEAAVAAPALEFVLFTGFLINQGKEKQNPEN
jgi:hypothetical protein